MTGSTSAKNLLYSHERVQIPPRIPAHYTVYAGWLQIGLSSCVSGSLAWEYICVHVNVKWWQKMVLQRWPCPNPWNLCLCYLTGQKRFADVFKILKWRDYSTLSGYTQCVRVLIRGRQEHPNQKQERWQWSLRLEWCPLEMKGPGARECSLSVRQDKETDYHLKFLEWKKPTYILILDFWPSEP